eukprot:15056131-Alexandrium_andersonii.AAC.1
MRSEVAKATQAALAAEGIQARLIAKGKGWTADPDAPESPIDLAEISCIDDMAAPMGGVSPE